MALRDAAALALVGWYLMVPPAERGTKQLDYRAPLSTWAIIQSFDTAQSCEAFIAKSLKGAPLIKGPKGEALVEIPYRCVATDDPRLAK